MDNNTKKDATSTSIKIPSDTIQNKIVKITVIKKLVKAIKEQLKELDTIQSQKIDNINCKEIDGILIATDSLINDCYSANEFNCNRNDNFIKLIYLYQRMLTRLEMYKLQEALKESESRNEELRKKQRKLENDYDKSKGESNNLIYNLLGFLASFSIVSASVEAISKIDGIMNIMLFIAFTILLLLTTLIALHNFYKTDNKRQTKLQDNYFLWKLVVVIVIILFIVIGIQKLIRDKDNFYKYIDNKIEHIIEQRTEKVSEGGTGSRHPLLGDVGMSTYLNFLD